MPAKRFNSKIDRWIFVVLALAIVGNFVAIIGVALDSEDPFVTTGVILACLLATALVVSLLIGTHYTVDHGQLRIASGPFRWKLQIDQITSVEPTRNPLSSPALSLDRLRIRYGEGRQILVSPADQRGFLRALGCDLQTRPRS
ncbi:MAG: PH domain-containing protein, partial [Gammaproteobacteria bacterium]|nr:PH domain-containing protein [Gammaproteobacteria bacterium]